MTYRLFWIAAILVVAVAAVPASGDEDMTALKTRMQKLYLRRGAPSAGSIRGILEAQKSDGSFPDVNYTATNRTNWNPRRHLSRIVMLARARAHPKFTDPNDAVLLKAIKLGLACWIRRDPRSTNWWQNEIGSPTQMAEILILVGDDLDGDLRGKAIKILPRARSRIDRMTGQNLVWTARVAMTEGLLTGDPNRVDSAAERIRSTVDITGKEGIQADFSFHQHGPQLYSYGYGAGFMNDVADFVVLTHGTEFALSDDKLKTFVDFLLEGQQWMMYRGVAEYGARGRETSRASAARPDTRRLLSPVERLVDLQDIPRADELGQLIARLEQKKEANPLTGNRHYWRSDIMIHRREQFYSSVNMASTRVVATESGNGEGLRNWYMGAGVHFLIRHGKEYRGIFPLWDWRHLPGTTVEQETGPLPECRWGGGARGKTSLVGGASDGRYGLAVYDYQKDNVTARKFWAMLGDRIVCLGAGIECDGNQPVHTTLNQCFARGDLSADVEVTGNKDMRRVRGASWIHHDGVGYVLLGETRASAVVEPRTGRWSDINRSQSKRKIAGSVFQAWIGHGEEPDEATYAYLLLPGASKGQAEQASDAPGVNILSNTPEIQAVWQPSKEILLAGFYKAGSVKAGGLKVTVEQPCAVSLRRNDRGWLLAIADPTGELRRMRLYLQGLGLADDRTRRRENSRSLTVIPPQGLYAGRSVLKEITPNRED